MASNTAKKKNAAASGRAASNRNKTTGGSRKNTKSAASGAQRSKKTVSAQKSSVRQIPQAQESKLSQTNPQIIKEAILWIILAVCIVVQISYFGIGGYIGDVISDFSFGILGVTAYVCPLLVFLACAFLISNRGNAVAGIKVVSAAVLYLCISGFAALLTGEYKELSTIMELFDYSAAHNAGGGVIGGSICRLLCPALGEIGTAIILIILSIASFVVITQKSLMRLMRRQSRKMYQSARESSERRRERHQMEEEQRYLRREEAACRYSHNPQAEAPKTQAQSRMMEDESEMPKQDTAVQGKKRREKRSGSAEDSVTGSSAVRQEIDVPVLFPVHERISRTQRRVTGVTMDTKLEDHRMPSATEIHEITPSASEGAFVPEENLPEEDTYYMELEKETEQEPQAPFSPFTIEGIELENETSSACVIPETEEWDDGPLPSKQAVSEPLAARQPISEPTPSKLAPSEAAPQELPSSAKKTNPRSSQEEIAAGIADVAAEISKKEEMPKPEYVFPPLNLLHKAKGKSGGQQTVIRQTAAKLEQTLNSFGVHVTVTNASCGPSVTRYELLPEQGVKVSRIVSLADDIKLNLAASDIRIEAPIPGKSAIGIEVPNKENSAVALRDLFESDEFQQHKSSIAFATGKDIGGKVVVSDIAKMPHLLIAGATGSGKSVCINTIIMSILYKAHPDDVKLIMIDPKVVELSVYNGIPHLFIPVVTDPKKAAGALNWGVAEMSDRYNKFAEYGVRDLKGYNKKIESLKDIDDENKPKKLPQIVIIVDELADLMMVAPGEVEDSICRLAQLARAAGIHLIIATQRPSVNVITGLIKANMPSRIAFAVTSSVDSRTIIDMGGAEKLLGKGDMLFYPYGYKKPARVQGAFVSDEEVSDVVDFLKNKNSDVSYDAEMEEQIAKVQIAASAARGSDDVDALFADAGKFIIDKDKASIGMLQRVFKIGFNRAARIMDQLAEAGVVGPEEGTKPRKILMSAEQFENYLEEN